jgi:xylulokinase
MAGANVTVGIDIGTSSVKAIAADDDGNVVARARIPHDFSVPSPQRFQHDARVAWHDGPQRALDYPEGGRVQLRGHGLRGPVAHCVDADGVPVTPGLLYGDERGHQEQSPTSPSGVSSQFLRWQAQARPMRAATGWRRPSQPRTVGRGEHLADRRGDCGRLVD